MKLFHSFLSVILLCSCVNGQSEFGSYDNGLIYSTKTMARLHRVVDSLNLKYKNCDINRKYYAVSQTVAHIISLDTLDVKQASKDLQSNMPLEIFIKKYPHTKVANDKLIIKYLDENYNNTPQVAFRCVTIGEDDDPYISKGIQDHPYNQPVAGTWLVDYFEKTEYHEESLSAFYFPTEFSSILLPQKYAWQIGYADCLIDTTVAKFKKEQFSDIDGGGELPNDWQCQSPDEQKQLLNQLRSTRVVGFCSQDSRPRMHAFNIAVLSAETTSWEIFLKAHLDIMNDRFDRMSDGSYAQAGRKTYIKELEALDINVPDLLFGIVLRIENAADQHYFGHTGRIGRAISESINRPQFEAQMLSMIADNELDDYNRIIAYFLFRNYLHYLNEGDEKKMLFTRLEDAVQKLPAYLKKGANLED